MSTIKQLAEAKGSIPLLMKMTELKDKLILSDLYTAMRKEGIGRRQTDTALKVCIDLDLIKREHKRIEGHPMPSIYHTLTSKGSKVAKILEDLGQALM